MIVLPKLSDYGKEKQSYYEAIITLAGEQSEKQRNAIQSPNTREI